MTAARTATIRSREPAWLRSRRRLAENLYRELPAPSFRYGLGVAYDPATVPLPFAPRPESGPQPAPTVSGGAGRALAWDEALRQKGLASVIREYLTAAAPPANKLWAWHEANCDGGTVIHLPRGYRPAEPIRLEYRQRQGTRADRLLIIAEAGSAATIIEHFSSASAEDISSFRSFTVDIAAAERAAINYVSIQDLDGRTVSFARKRARCARSANVSWMCGHFGGDLISDSVATDLEGAGSRTAMRGLFFGAGTQRFDLLQEARHLAPGTVADLASRGALTGQARAICRGLIRMERGSRGCQGRQRTDTLLLHEKARAASMPALQIAEDDVRCSHASATGRLDREHLFYLMSRGLDEAAAIRQLVGGFFAPLIREMRTYGLEDMVSCLIGHRLGSPHTFSPDEICLNK